MIVSFNILIVAVALLIAYWWANQGAFSALLHFVCVLAAAAMAFGLWEVVAIRLFGTGLQDYALGVSLLGLFAAFLFVFRLACDRLVPANLNFRPGINYLAGAIFGGLAGVVTVGMVLLGAGYMQGTTELLGHRGWQRTAQSPGTPTAGDPLWVPAHEWVAASFAHLSSTSLAPEVGSASLKNRRPHIDRESLGELRDTFRGRSKVGIDPSQVTLLGAVTSDRAPLPQKLGGTQNIYAVGVQFDKGAFDGGQRFTLSPSQVRLIAETPPTVTAPVVHPFAWTADLRGGTRGAFPFDDKSFHVTNVPGQQSVTVWLLFKESQLRGYRPRFLSIKGVRFTLPAITPTEPSQVIARILGADAMKPPELDPRLPTLADNSIRLYSGIEPVQISENELTGNMKHLNRMLLEGKDTFPTAASRRISRELIIQGIFEPEGTRVVRLDASRNRSPLNIWDSLERRRVGDEVPVTLVDEVGQTYEPIGYLWVRSTDARVDILLDPVRGLPRVGELPTMSASGGDEFFLIYRVTVGSTIKAVRLGEVQVANVDLAVE
jgi:uncharacterized membrane protein required for colicin V production